VAAPQSPPPKERVWGPAQDAIISQESEFSKERCPGYNI